MLTSCEDVERGWRRKGAGSRADSASSGRDRAGADGSEEEGIGVGGWARMTVQVEGGWQSDDGWGARGEDAVTGVEARARRAGLLGIYDDAQKGALESRRCHPDAATSRMHNRTNDSIAIQWCIVHVTPGARHAGAGQWRVGCGGGVGCKRLIREAKRGSFKLAAEGKRGTKQWSSLRLDH
jgi:hypothetical protein